ncbi:MAG: calcium/sodium antiporter [Fimbriimonadaceae bacterium]
MIALAIIAVVAGLAILAWSADRFVDGAASLALHLGWSPMLIGILIVGFGTSAPELVVSAISAWTGNPGIAVGNAIGSNIANIGLILGAAAAMTPLVVASGLIRKELPLLFLVTAVMVAFLWDGALDFWLAVIMLVLFLAVMGYLVRSSLSPSAKDDPISKEMESEVKPERRPLWVSIGWVVGGLLLLIGSSRLLVWGGVELATMIGISELVIGLSVVAIGTSLPELASAIAAARKKEHDLILGNIVGSNLFNSLAVVGLAGVVAPISVSVSEVQRDLLAMVLFTVALFVISWSWRREKRIERWEGILLLIGFVVYLGVLVLMSTGAAFA